MSKIEVKPGHEFLERFELVRLIGQGGMGSVYEARESELNRRVAVKFLLGDTWDDVSLDRFFEEALALARLQHPNILRVIDHGDRYEQPFIAFEFIEGGTVQQRIAKDGALPISTVALWADQLCSAMEHAHGQGIMHRDLKSENLMIDMRGDVKVADFGLARRDDRRAKLTATGMIMGTPAYISPEQAVGHDATMASDIYSAAVVLFEMATGELPFRDDNISELLAAHRNRRPPDPRHIRQELPVAFATVILDALAKEPSARPEDFTALRDALADVFSRTPSVQSTMKTEAIVHTSDGVKMATQESESPKRRSKALRSTGSSITPQQIVPPSRNRRVLFLVIGSIALFLLLGWFWAGRTGPLRIEGLSIAPKVQSVDLLWKSDRPAAFRWSLALHGRTMASGREKTPCLDHTLAIAKLGSGRRYTLRLSAEETSVERSFVTSKARLLRGVWTCAFRGSLFADFETNLERGLRFTVVAPTGATRSRTVSGGKATVLVSGFDPRRKSRHPFRWKLSTREDQLLASGDTPLEPRLETALGQIPHPERQDRWTSPDASSGPVVWDDYIALTNRYGSLTCFHLSRADHPTPLLRAKGHGLETAWVFRPPVRKLRHPNDSLWCAGGLSFDDGLLYAAFAAPKGIVRFWAFDVVERRKAWLARIGDSTPKRLPSWVEDKTDPWHRPIGKREWFFDSHLDGDPRDDAIHHKAYLYVQTQRPWDDVGRAYYRWIGIDPKRPGRYLWSRGWASPPKKDDRTFGRFTGKPTIAGERIFSLVRIEHETRPLKKQYPLFHFGLLCCPLDREKASALCFDYRTLDPTPTMTVDPSGRSIWLTADDGLLEWPIDGSRKEPRIVDMRSLTKGKVFRCLSGGPVIVGDEFFTILFEPDPRDNIASAAFGLENIRGVIATCSGTVPKRMAPVMTDMARDMAPHIVRLTIHDKKIIGMGRHSLFVLDLATGRINDTGAISLSRLAVDPRGLLITCDCNGKMKVLTADLLLASNKARIKALVRK